MPPGEKENHLQKCLNKGHVSSVEGTSKGTPHGIIFTVNDSKGGFCPFLAKFWGVGW